MRSGEPGPVVKAVDCLMDWKGKPIQYEGTEEGQGSSALSYQHAVASDSRVDSSCPDSYSTSCTKNRTSLAKAEIKNWTKQLLSLSVGIGLGPCPDVNRINVREVTGGYKTEGPVCDSNQYQLLQMKLQETRKWAIIE
ncbi:hypothetical protein UY3_08571 [Chelonia mydas]|uniref:Uncharacterized protein n=1 Tax=Chelonia mydas TaxID=8469 RepID=M7B8K0_CHEMY|nr:hypothetical protein UY3_08571 [Chelonia mydas]